MSDEKFENLCVTIIIITFMLSFAYIYGNA
jgi:hypothetical protein